MRFTITRYKMVLNSNLPWEIGAAGDTVRHGFRAFTRSTVPPDSSSNEACPWPKKMISKIEDLTLDSKKKVLAPSSPVKTKAQLKNVTQPRRTLGLPKKNRCTTKPKTPATTVSVVSINIIRNVRKICVIVYCHSNIFPCT